MCSSDCRHQVSTCLTQQLIETHGSEMRGQERCPRNKYRKSINCAYQNVKKTENKLTFLMLQSFLCSLYIFITFSIPPVKTGRSLELSFLRSDIKLFFVLVHLRSLSAQVISFSSYRFSFLHNL